MTMDSHSLHLHLHALPGLVMTMTYIAACGIFGYLAWRRFERERFLPFTALCLLLGLYTLCHYHVMQADAHAQAVNWTYRLYLTIGPLTIAFYESVVAFSNMGSRLMRRLVWVVGVALPLLQVLFGLLVGEAVVHRVALFGYEAEIYTYAPSVIGRLAMLYIVVLLVWLLAGLYRAMRREQSLTMFFIGCTIFGACIVNDILVANHLYTFFFLSPIGFLAVAVTLAAYLLRNAVRHYDTVERQQQQIAEMAERQRDLFTLISHELRTPLTALLGYLTMMQDRKLGPVPEELERPLRSMSLSAHRLLVLVNDTLELARLGHRELEIRKQPLDVDQLLTAVAEEVRATYEATGRPDASPVESETSQPASEVIADRELLERILLNVINFLIKTKPDGGPLRVGARQEPARTVITVRHPNLFLAERDCSRLFEPFYTPSGSAEPGPVSGSAGLDLAIAHELAVLLHAGLEVTSRPDLGAQFSLSLPR